MTRENLIKDHAHFCRLVNEEFSSRDFDVDYGDSGRMSMEEMPKVRIKLIKSDALRHKLDIERKHPWLKEFAASGFGTFEEWQEDIKKKVEEARKKAEAKKKAGGKK